MKGILLIMITLFASNLFSQSYNFEAAWQEIENFENNGMYKEGLDKSNEIYSMAVKQKNEAQKCKATLYKANFTLGLNEDGALQAQKIFEDEIAKAPDDYLPIYHHYYANFLENYFQNNLYIISQRTETIDNNLLTMTTQSFLDKIDFHYKKSLELINSKKFSVDDSKLFLNSFNDRGKQRLTTLYEVFAQKLINFSNIYNSYSLKKTITVNDEYFSTPENFVATYTKGNDYTLDLFHDILSKEIKEKNEFALAYFNLLRLEYVANLSIDKTESYRSALRSGIAKYKKLEIVPEYYVRLIYTYMNEGKENSLIEAKKICDECVGSSLEDSGQCATLRDEITQPSLVIMTKQAYYPKDKIEYKITHKNLKKVYFKIIKDDNNSKLSLNNPEEYRALYNKVKPLKSWELSLVPSNNYLTKNELFSIDGLPSGRYVLCASNSKDFDQSFQISQFTVSKLAYMSINENTFLVVERKTGTPIPGAKVDFYTVIYDYNTQLNNEVFNSSATTDKEGKVKNNLHNLPVRLKITKGKDEFKSINYHHSFEQHINNYQNFITEIYTDRTVYRPGQIVYFKAIKFETGNNIKPRLAKNSDIKVRLTDVNGQEVGVINLKTNEYGSASGNFVLPQGKLTGYYTLQSENSGRGILVEEYKRPTFEVKFDTSDVAYKLGQTVKVTGAIKAYAGNTLPNATVEYTITKNAIMPFCYRWYPYNRYSGIYESGVTKSDENGKFSISFEAIDEKERYSPIYTYTISIKAVDQTGETQNGEFSIRISNKAKFLSTNIPNIFDKAKGKEFKIEVKDINDKLYKEKGTYKVISLIHDPTIYENDIWGELGQADLNPLAIYNKYTKLKDGKVVKQGSYLSGENLDLSTLEAGIYRIEASLDNNEADMIKEYFEVIDFKKKKFSLQNISLQTNKEVYEVGDKVIMELGSAEKQDVYYRILRNHEVLKSGWLKCNNVGKIEYTIKEEDKGNVFLQYAYIKNNRFYNNTHSIIVSTKDKELDIKFENFRDKLNTGEQTDFKIIITRKDGKKLESEVLASMYDAALDVYQGHYWNKIGQPLNTFYSNINASDFNIQYANELFYEWNQISYPEPTLIILPAMRYPNLIDYGSRDYYTNGSPRYRSEQYSKASADGLQETGSAVLTSPPPAAKMGQAENEVAGKAKSTYVNPRTNLKETVFFYPHMKTDKEGRLILSFKNNEALTRWKLMILAHTKDLAVGYDEKIITTSKQVMITANSPRFVRTGDEIIFTARVSNLTTEPLTANAKLDFINALKETPVTDLIKSDATIPVSLNPGESKSVSWKLVIPNDKFDMLKYIVSVTAGNYTDAESSLLPIQNNRILITESLAMYLKARDKKNYEFKSLLNQGTKTPHKYVIEVSSHPIWYAIQAMPYIIDQDNRSSTQLANRLYVNSLSRYIIAQYPQIERVYTEWQNKDQEALKSNLQKNQELKSANLEESPWVRDAINESNEKANISRIFDENNVNADIIQTLQALRNLQNPDGSFSWFPGGRADWYSTIYVTEMLGKVYNLQLDPEAYSIAEKAFNYLDKELEKQYEELKKNTDKLKGKLDEYQPSETIIKQLYTRSLFPNLSVKGSEAYPFYRKQMIKYWNKYDIFSQALIGIIDYRNKGNTYLDISKSMLQKSFKSDELGMYWNAGNGYRWYELPIERHAAIMEFYNETKQDEKILDEMKVWLIKNKQSNSWATSSATAAAIHALLLHRGPKQANLNNDFTVISKVGSVELPGKADVQAGTVYYKKTWQADEIKKDMAQIYLSNPNDNVSWAGAYYQYFEDVNKVKQSTGGSPLKITKQLYKEVVKGNKKELVLLDKNNTLKPGDILVSRIIIESDRDMEYIHLKDLRASGLEPFNNTSGYRWNGGFGYYESIRDAASHYFIDRLPKGTHVFESRQKVIHKGRYSGGLATIQSFYAPEFGSKTEGNSILVE